MQITLALTLALTLTLRSSHKNVAASTAAAKGQQASKSEVACAAARSSKIHTLAYVLKGCDTNYSDTNKLKDLAIAPQT